MLPVIASCSEHPPNAPWAKIENDTTTAEETTPQQQSPISGQQLHLSIHDVPRQSAATSFDKTNGLPDFFKQEKEKKRLFVERFGEMKRTLTLWIRPPLTVQKFLLASVDRRP